MIKKIISIFESKSDSFIEKKRSLCDLELININEKLEKETDEKIIKYLKRKLSRVKHKCKELWR